ncbi:uncharacterized protein K441DRAFT_744120 [Cenococcum geophilum 1.58]|uniref:Uncharacterized protein n=1 Tax=Cenococcum geophilum 1.58 TaxID=794803 RepID=A0ACC8ELB2_9PEZI|nr:hypothetical protein K441DRAFT_744120 [Cenococcum geophilum 1.58]
MVKSWDVAPRHVLMASSMSGLTPAASTKNSSTELSEAINSMFRWYQGAATCYAVFASCQQFTRGWTLQELIAPSTVEFPASNSAEIGTRTSLPDEIAKIIGISPRILCKTGRVDGANIAQGMSWAAQRETTWSEDKAYCLMGLFRVNMPMLYRGEKAFERLQLEIIKKSHDHSIFAWSLTPKRMFSASYLPNTRGLLSYSPAEFGHCEKILASTEMVTEPYSMANLGLFIKLPIVDR